MNIIINVIFSLFKTEFVVNIIINVIFSLLKTKFVVNIIINVRVTEVRSKILTPLETTGGNFFHWRGLKNAFYNSKLYAG